MHKPLCEKAVAYLKRPHSKGGLGCSFAFSETAPLGALEIPDAIGWHGADSTLIEVKVSRADFLADAKKPHRRNPKIGLGVYRYYLTPEGMVHSGELPPGWGLIEQNVRGALKPKVGRALQGWYDKDTWRHETDRVAEVAFLVRMLVRVGDPAAVHMSIKSAQLDAQWHSDRYHRLVVSHQNAWAQAHKAGIVKPPEAEGML